MKRAVFLVVMLSIALPAAIVLAATVQKNLAITVTSPPSQGGDILPPDRDASANWRLAGLQSVGGIPNRSTQCGVTISPIGGGANDTPKIQNAIDQCPAGQVVKLAAGNFTIADGSYLLINKAVSVRGAGAGVTLLQRTDGAQLEPRQPYGSSPTPLIILGPARYGIDYMGSTNLTADAAQGANSITVADASHFSVGQIVLLDEVSGAGWQRDVTGASTQIWASPDFRVTWKKHNPYLTGDDFDANTYPYTAGSAGCGYSRCDRATNEIKEIASISGNIVTFTSPFTISYRTSHTAQMTWWGNSDIPGSYTPHVRNAGIETLSVRNGDDGAVEFNLCAYCWAKNIENSIWNGVGIRFVASFRDELREFYSHDAAYSRPGGGAYAIGLDRGSSEVLVEDGISIMADKVIVARAAGSGSVIGYNYVDMGFIDFSEGWIEIGLNASHFVGPHHVLFEGNYAFNIDSDNTHGASTYMTFLRNWSRGLRRSFVNPGTGDSVDDASQGNSPQRAGATQAYGYWFSFIGNVLGASGQMSGWTYQGDLTSGKSVWALGWGDSDANGTWHQDPQVSNLAFGGHVIRDGNWDWLTTSQHWDDTPVTIPNSFYLTSAPDFFGANPWPWVNPVTGAVTTLPAKARYDAGTPNCNC